jgi:hypothetical protein
MDTHQRERAERRTSFTPAMQKQENRCGVLIQVRPYDQSG